MTDEKTPIAIDDLYQFIKVEDPQISPDGAWVAYVRVTIDRVENGYKRSIWLCPVAGGEPRQLTRGEKDSQPRWSPDGRTLAFVSARADKPQIYLLPVQTPGGEARQLTSMANGAGSPAWSPDGEYIAFLSASTEEERKKEDSGEKPEPPADNLEAKQRKERQEEEERLRLDPYRMWRVPYRSGTSFLSERYAQVYVMPVAEGLEGDDARPRRLTSVNADHQPPKWSADGRLIYTARQMDPAADEPFTGQGVYSIDLVSGSAKLLSDTRHTTMAPLPSPDGKWLAVVRLPRGEYGDLEAIPRLAVMPLDGDGDVRDLNLELDRSIADYKWQADSSAIVFTATDRGNVPVYAASIAGGSVSTLIEGVFSTTGIDVGPDGSVAMVVSTPVSLPELKVLPAGEKALRDLTDFNGKWLSGKIVQETHEMWFESPSGKDIQGWYILPVGYEEGKKYPLALNIHGGPRAMWGPSENTMFHEWQVHAASGYVVFYCNPRGGDGYGEAFQRDLHSAWGEVAMEDIMAGVDKLLEKGFVDADRLAITGGSYGGYMTAWIVGHSDRFKSAVAQRGVYNLVSFYGTTDVPILIASDFATEPWKDSDLLWKHSPVAYADKITTPLLILHAENDYRVPIEQAEQLFAWVRRATDTPVEMIRYPRDGHELSRSGEPKHRVDRLTRMVEWFDRYCKV
ncbi:MAG: prolyl oligopeptidase family serine peptidase [Chloroflexota bacterium]